MSNPEQGLLQAILQEPKDTPRLIYADWLEEHDQHPRATFIRTQIRLARSPDCGHRSPIPDCQRCDDLQSEEALLSEHGDAWLNSLPGEGWTWCRQPTWQPRPATFNPDMRVACFVRGFVGFVVLSTSDFEEDAHLLVNGLPLEKIQLTDRWPSVDSTGKYFWSDNGPSNSPHQLPWFLRQDLPRGDYLAGKRWTTEAEALEGMSQACLECGRNHGNKIGRQLVYSTGQVAKILQVSPATVCRWFDSGKLRGYRDPGSKERRIPREHLARFIREQRFFEPPPPTAAGAPARVISAEDCAEELKASLERIRHKQVLTTGEVARLCQVAPRTVVKWFDSGLLHGHRSGGGNHRMIPRESLLRFARENGMPLVGWDTSSDQVAE